MQTSGYVVHGPNGQLGEAKNAQTKGTRAMAAMTLWLKYTPFKYYYLVKKNQLGI